MTHLTYIQHPRYAQAFVDYLRTLGIVAHARPSAGTMAIQLDDPNQLHRAQQELTQFLAEPEHERYWQASWLVEEDEQAADTLSRIYRGPSVWRVVKGTGWVTWLVMGICVVVYFLTGEGESTKARASFMFFPTVEAMLDSGQIWRWIAPAVLHFGAYHITFNLFAWWIFGGLVERVQSPMRLLGLFLALALIGNVAQFFWGGNQFGGLSGVVYGLLGYLWLYPKVNPAAPFRLPRGMVVFMWLMVVTGFLPIFPFANLAHLGGLLGGCALGAGLAWLDKQEPPR